MLFLGCKYLFPEKQWKDSQYDYRFGPSETQVESGARGKRVGKEGLQGNK